MTVVELTCQSLVGVALAMLCVANAQAQLSHNMPIGNPVSLAMANFAVAYIEGPDATHFNPAALALIENEYKQYRPQLSFIDHQGSISGQGNGQSFDVFDNPDFQQDPLLQGQRSREIETTSLSLFLPFFEHVEQPFLIAPGYGFAMRSDNGKVVFANSALAIQAFGYQRDKDNVAAFNGQQFGITRISYFNPSFGFELQENLYLGFSIGFAWQGLGIFTSN